MIGTILQTFEKEVLTMGDGVTKYGGQRPDWYDYPNNSRIWTGGMDDPDKVLSSARDVIAINQAEKLTLEDYETLTTRATGRAGNMPWGQIVGDCNPSTPSHWIKVKASGGELALLESVHEDNPALWDAERQQWTERGKRSLAILGQLSGVRKQRFLFGQWAAAEGIVYDCFTRAKHVRPAPPGSALAAHVELVKQGVIQSVAGVDWGFTNPGVISVWSVDGDSRMKRVAQLYRTGQLIDWWIDQARQLMNIYHIRTFVCDPSRPDYIQQFIRAGLPAVPAFNDISLGIQNMYGLLSTMVPASSLRGGIESLRQGLEAEEPMMIYIDGTLKERDEELARLHKPTCSEEEIESYVWPTSSGGKPIKEIPVKENDHGMDADRYAAAHVHRLTKHAPQVWVAA